METKFLSKILSKVKYARPVERDRSGNEKYPNPNDPEKISYQNYKNTVVWCSRNKTIRPN